MTCSFRKKTRSERVHGRVLNAFDFQQTTSAKHLNKKVHAARRRLLKAEGKNTKNAFTKCQNTDVLRLQVQNVGSGRGAETLSERSGRGAETLSETSGRGKVERNTFPPNARGWCQQPRNRSGKCAKLKRAQLSASDLNKLDLNQPPQNEVDCGKHRNASKGDCHGSGELPNSLEMDQHQLVQWKVCERPRGIEQRDDGLAFSLDDLEKVLNNGPQPFNLKGSGGTWLMWQKTPLIKCQFVMEPLHSTVEVRATCKPPKIAKDLGKFGRKGQQAGDTKDTLRHIDRHFTGNVTHNFATTAPGDLLLTSATHAKSDKWVGVHIPSVTKEQMIPGASDDDDEPDF
eukprot:jgi/Bigna1/77605/fgenesh1_pg.49_\